MNVAFEWREASRHVDSLYLLYLGNGPDATSNSHNDVIMVPTPPLPLSFFFLPENLLLMSHKEGVSADLLFILIFIMVGFEQISFDLKYGLFFLPPLLSQPPLKGGQRSNNRKSNHYLNPACFGTKLAAADNHNNCFIEAKAWQKHWASNSNCGQLGRKNKTLCLFFKGTED